MEWTKKEGISERGYFKAKTPAGLSIGLCRPTPTLNAPEGCVVAWVLVEQDKKVVFNWFEEEDPDIIKSQMDKCLAGYEGFEVDE